MRRFLRQIYSISLSTLACPIEYFIASVVGQIPVPIEGGRPFHVMLDAALIAPTSTAMAPIIFQLPNKQDFTHMDLDFAAPLRSFSVENFLTVFTLMLREAKMIFICRSNTLLTETMETLKSLLFPLTWSSCFVSRLPDALLGMLEAPGGFMIGLHVPDENYVSTNEVDMHYHHRSKVRSSESAVEYLVRRICSRNSIAEGTYLFDLSYNKLYQYKGNSMSPLSSNTLESLLRMLPGGPRIRLQQKLHSIAERYEIGPQTKGLEEFDSAFDFQSPDEGKVTAQMWRDFPTLVIRDAFMVFMIDLLGNFPKYLIPPIEDLSADTFRTFKEEFYVNEYLLDADPSGTRPLLSLLMETQMFAVLLQQRSEGEQFNVVFFENAASLLRELELSAGGHGSRTNHANNIAEMPAPLYQLLATKIRWAALSKLSRAQIIERFPSFLNGEKEQSIHQLSIIHISSGLSPIKGANLLSFTKTHRSLHPMTNESLKDLITLWRVVSADQISSDGKHEESIHSIYQMRTELDRNEDLMLHDPNFGPLVIPGPILVDPQCKDVEVNEKDWRRLLLDRSIARSGEFGVTLEYSYPRGFPMFDQQLLEDALKYAIHPQLREIRADRAFAIEQVLSLVKVFNFLIAIIPYYLGASKCPNVCTHSN